MCDSAPTWHHGDATRGKSLDVANLDQRLSTITQIQKGPFGTSILFADLTKDQEAYGYRLPSEVQAKQLGAIHMHNEKLPPRKKKKEALDELPAVNVYCKVGTQLEKVKKKGVKPKLLVTYDYRNIGMADEGFQVDPDAPRAAASAFSIHNQTRELQRRSSKMRIAQLRKNYGGILKTATKATEVE